MTFEAGLAAVLLIAVPALGLWREASGAHLPRIVRYRAATMTIAVLLGVLATRWIVTGRSSTLLGLNLPPTPLGGCCLLGAAVLLAGAAVVIHRKPPAATDRDDPLPRTSRERAAFAVFAVAAGCGWEILYRGFLLYALAPPVGIAAAVCMAALAYGVAHGIRDRKRAVAGIASALMFTTGFALTRDLWWLMLIHTGLPLLAVSMPPRRGAGDSTPEKVVQSAGQSG